MQPPIPGIGRTITLSPSPRPRTGPLHRRLGTGLTAFLFMATVLGTVATASPARATATTLYARAPATTPGSSAAALGRLVPTGANSATSAPPARLHPAWSRPRQPGVRTQLAAPRQGTDPRAPAPRAGIANAPSFESPDSDFTSIFTPLPTLPALVKAPSVKQTAAFAALNALLDTETRFGEAVVAMRVSLDRAEAAAGADEYDAQLWLVRQANASAEYALAASRLLGRFPALQAAVVRAFVADKMTVTLTPAQFAAARAKLLRGLPASFTHLLAVAAAPYEPTTVPEVAALRAAILDTGAIKRALKHLVPKALVLPAALASSSVTVLEVKLAAALKGYADTILQPVPAPALGGMARRLEPDARFTAACEEPGEQIGHGLEKAEQYSKGLGAGFQTLGGEAGVGATESFVGPLSEMFGSLFAFAAFNAASGAFDVGGGGGGGGAGGAGGGGCGEGGGSGDSAASYGDPHQLTFSGAGYDFQAAGEFTLVKSTTDDLDIQVRQQPFPGTASIAIDTAAAMRVNGSVVELAANASGDLQVFIDHRAVAFASRALAGGGRLSALRPGWATVTWPDGTAVSVYSLITVAHPVRVSCNSSDAIDLTITVPPSRFGHLEGLLGDPGAPAGELVGGNGATYSMEDLARPWESVHNFDVLYHQFAQSWRVSQQSSLFYYPKGTSTTSFTDLVFPSKALTVASLTPTSVAAAERVCKAEGITNRDLLADCVYDVGVTGASGACFAGADARVQAATGGPSASGLPESSGTVPSSSTTTKPQPTTTALSTIAPTAESTGPVVVDPAGSGYVTWEERVPGGNGDSVAFCKVPSGGKCARKLRLPLPRGVTWADYAIDLPFPVLGAQAGVVYVVGPSYAHDDVVIWTSKNGGTSFSTPQVIPGYAGQTGVGDVLRAPVGVPYPDYFSVAASGPSLSYTFTGTGTIGGQPPQSGFVFNLGSLQGSPVGATLGFSGQETVEAFSTDANLPPLAYFWSPSPRVSGGEGSLEHGPTVVAVGTNPRLAGGPGGLFLLSEDQGAKTSSPLELHVRKWDTATHTFGAPTLVATVPNDINATNEGGFAEDAHSGKLYVAWPGPGPNGSYVMHVWTSANGGKTFYGPTTVATISGYGGPARVAVTRGKGFLTWEDSSGLELVDLSL